MMHGDVPAFRYCMQCGKRIAFKAVQCPDCGAPTDREGTADDDTSPKSFGVAVTLCALFGLAGVHHYYIGNILHGLFDSGLFVVTILLFVLGSNAGNEGLLPLGVILLLVDIIHSIVVFFRLIVGKQRDGKGRRIRYPGQA